jgi:hypothetical protein
MNRDKADPIQIENRPANNPEDLLDVTELVRSVQRREGNPDCYGRAGDSCDQRACVWRPWCLKNIEEPMEQE